MIIILNHVTIAHMLRSPTGIVGRDARRRAHRVRAVARTLAPKRSGRLAASISAELKIRPSGVAYEVGSHLNYARYVHDGTGVYGPFGRPITARSGSVMVFRGRDGGVVYARTVSGTRGTHYLTRALVAAL